MNDYKTCCVIDKDSYYVDLVIVHMESDPQTGETVERIEKHVLQEGESLVLRTDDIRQPTLRTHAGQTGFIRPRWDDNGWVEGCTEAEIAVWEAEHPAPEIPPKLPTQGDINSQAIAELSILIASGGVENV
ncbi:hypothetical protein RWV98_05900 [Agathobaculum sp. NTUH-O15-33]|uniref:hypothetical protein n=1 Tax=Agathobaculum sp. NTUH-O15-33 TaxID=3079302 RepID=UPI0029586FB8|nr:hypothetical protein [Agathobaculum sp. NTUH-O15-33]WNX85801.1 hypothetical protein RWV98_05900 [Agathobaculum sp. NTUH-O15-33]